MTTTLTPMQRLALRVGDRIEHNWHQILLLVSSLAVTAAGVPGVIFGQSASDHDKHSLLPGHWGWPQYLLILGAAGIVTATLRQQTIRPTYSELKQELDAAQAANVTRAWAMEGVLRAVLTRLSKEFHLENSTSRVSLYCHAGTEFALLTRVSANTKWKKRGRSTYPENEGTIATAWEEGAGVLKDLPDDRTDWNAKMVQHGIPAAVAQSLNMQSRSIVAIRMDSVVAGEQVPIGIVVMESTLKRGVKGELIDAVPASDTWTLLVNALGNAHVDFADVATTLARLSPP